MNERVGIGSTYVGDTVIYFGIFIIQLTSLEYHGGLLGHTILMIGGNVTKKIMKEPD